MIHGVHRFQVYTKKWHHLVGFVLTFLPLIILLGLGVFGQIDVTALGEALATSFYRLISGYSISLILGVGVALLVGASKWGDAVVPVLDVMQNIPSFALIPVFVLFFGYTSTMAILFVATSVIWPILFYVLSAIRTARVDWGEAAQIFGARGYRRIVYYLLPLSMPAIITGSIVGLSIGWEAVIGVEIIGLTTGIGPFLGAASATHNNALLAAGLGFLLALVFIMNRLLWAPLLKRTHLYAE